MMARLLWMYSVSVTSLSDLYRKGLSGASTQLSYFSSKRKKKIQVRCQRKIWLSCRQCSFALGIGGFPKVILLNWILKPTMGLPEDIAFFSK
ncbi:uncharacterized protein [Coffea arabica]|uniref:Uncharacterized protein isoform X11 n=1 Tax=Coffea arabica TaxID=13443 RepID=A0ABM4VVQ5_COFAR